MFAVIAQSSPIDLLNSIQFPQWFPSLQTAKNYADNPQNFILPLTQNMPDNITCYVLVDTTWLSIARQFIEAQNTTLPITPDTLLKLCETSATYMKTHTITIASQ